MTQCARRRPHARHETSLGTCPGLTKDDDPWAPRASYQELVDGLETICRYAADHHDHLIAAYAHSLLSGVAPTNDKGDARV